MTDIIKRKLILASGSRARAGLLQAAGVAFEVCVSGVDEDKIKSAYKGIPAQLALALAAAKAQAVYADNHDPDILILAADQLLVCEDVIFDKPADMVAARAHLEQLRGRSHRLVNGLVLLAEGECVWRYEEETRLTMRDFSAAFLDDYLAQTGEAILSSVGAYQIEGLGVQLFSDIEGDYTGILGLPLVPLLAALRHYGVLHG
ncbi:MAG: Maf-like protein [Alphaproteobacteria bacterium]|nr:Maf-like protein [Alphaproteobacteria bacterium]